MIDPLCEGRTEGLKVADMHTVGLQVSVLDPVRESEKRLGEAEVERVPQPDTLPVRVTEGGREVEPDCE